MGSEQIEQRLDLGVTFGDLLEVELVSREVLPQTEQVFLAIVAGQRSLWSAKILRLRSKPAKFLAIFRNQLRRQRGLSNYEDSAELVENPG